MNKIVNRIIWKRKSLCFSSFVNSTIPQFRVSMTGPCKLEESELTLEKMYDDRRRFRKRILKQLTTNTELHPSVKE